MAKQPSTTASGSKPDDNKDLPATELSAEEKAALGEGADDKQADPPVDPEVQAAMEADAAAAESDKASREADEALVAENDQDANATLNLGAIRPIQPGVTAAQAYPEDKEEMVEMWLPKEVRIQDPPGTIVTFPAGKTKVPKRLENHWFFKAHQKEQAKRRLATGTVRPAPQE